MKKILLITTAILTMHEAKLKAQCTNTYQYPTTEIIASQNNDTFLIDPCNYAGDYFVIKNLALNKTYRFITNVSNDYITVREFYTGAILSSGYAPFDYTVGSGPDIVSVHINLSNPPCGTDNYCRTTRSLCTNCDAEGSKVGIKTNTPKASLEVAGKIKLGDDALAPQAGTIRWNADTKDFEGYDGSEWISFSKGKSNWGVNDPQKGVENHKLTAIDGLVDDKFGASVDINNEYAIVGAPNDDHSSLFDNGSAYIFHKSNSSWMQQAKLIPTDGMNDDEFGTSVAIYGDFAVVGSIRSDIGGNYNQGSIYIFKRNGNTWTQHAKLWAADGATGDQLGHSVGIFGEYCIASSKNNNSLRGAVYIFKRTGDVWTQQVKLTASDGAIGDQFGYSLSIDNDYIAIGSPFSDVGTFENQGAAYIFKRTGTSWTEQAKILFTIGDAQDGFGSSVSLNGNQVLISAPYFNLSGGTNLGRVMKYSRTATTWSNNFQYENFNGGSDNFGSCVSLSNNESLILTKYSNIETGRGFCYPSGTNIFSSIDITGDFFNDGFGETCKLSANKIIVGAKNQNGVSLGTGAAYIFEK